MDAAATTSVGSGPPPNVPTAPEAVTVRLTSGVEVSGNVHVRPDGYQSRVSDLLNRSAMDFLPITDATMERPDGTFTTTDCVIVRRTQIETVVCDEVSAGQADETPVDDRPGGDGPAADDAAEPATPLGVRAGW